MTTKPAMATDIPASILTPNSVETRLGTLRFFDGLPDEETAKTVYDNLDFQRAVQAYLTTVQAATLHTERATCRSFGPDNCTVLITESLIDSRSLYTIANAEVMYNVIWLDTKDGPLVIEVPPDVLGFINDFWSRWVSDVGRPGPERGRAVRTCCSRRTTRATSRTASSRPCAHAPAAPTSSSARSIATGTWRRPSRTRGSTSVSTRCPRRRGTGRR